MSDKLTPEEAWERLFFAAEDGDAETVAEMLSVPSIDVNKRSLTGDTPFSRAGDPEVIELLKAAGAVDKRDE